MAFDYTNLYPDTSQNGAFTKSWNYTTVVDSVATCAAVGYFNKVATRLGIGDNIIVAQVDAFDKTRSTLLDHGELFVTGISGGVVTTSRSGVDLSQVMHFTDTTEATGLGVIYAARFDGGVEIAKKLFVAGAVSLASTLAVAGNLAVNTNKFTVAAASGNTAIAGTLGVAGLATLDANGGAQVAPSTGTNLHIIGADNATNGINLDSYGAFPIVTGRRSQGTQAAKTVPVDTNNLVGLDGAGWTGTAYYTGGQVRVNARETFSATAGGSSLSVFTTPLTTQAIAEAVRFQPSGGMSIGAAAIASDPGIGSLNLSASLKVLGTTASTSTTTGCATFAGGVGIAGNLTAPNVTAPPATNLTLTSQQVVFASPGSANFSVFNGGIATWYPSPDNTMIFGDSTHRWLTIWLGTGGLDSTGPIKSSSATGGVGYAAGAGGDAGTQATSKSTAVTLNQVCGKITMNAAALAAAAKVTFTVNNTTVVATDMIVVEVQGGGTANAYRATIAAVAANSFAITVENITAGSLSESPVIQFFVLKSVNA